MPIQNQNQNRQAIRTVDQRIGTVQTNAGQTSINMRIPELIWVKCTGVGQINLQTNEELPAVNVNAAAWEEQESDQFGQPRTKLNGATGSLTQNPLIGSGANSVFMADSYYYIRPRTSVPNTYFQLWEPLGDPSCGVVSSVQCSGNVLMVTYCAT